MRLSMLFAVVAVLAAAALVSAADDDTTNLSEFFSEKDAAALEASLVAELASKNGVLGSAQANFQGAWALTQLSSANLSKNKASLCKAAQADLASAVSNSKQVNLEVAADALRLSALLSCSGGDASAAVAAAKEGLNSANPATLFHATAILAATKTAVDAGDLSAVIQSVVDLQKDEGLFGPEGDDEGTLEAAGQALETIKTVSSMTKLADSDWDTLSQVADKASALVDKMMESLENEANLVAVVQIFEGLQLLANSPAGDKIAIEHENVAMIADTLVAVKSSPLTTEAGYVVRGLHLSADNKFYVPLVVSLITKAVSVSAKGQDGHIKVRVTDVQGKSVGKVSVTLTAAKLGDTVVHQAISLSAVPGSNDVYEFNFLSSKVEHGTYSLELSVVPESKAKPYGELAKVKRTVRATTSAAIASFELAIQDAKTGEGAVKQIDFPKQLPKGLTADYLQAVEISFTVRSLSSNKVFSPHQAFVRFQAKNSDFEAIFVSRVIDRRQKLKLVVADAAAEVFKNRGGEYDVEIIVGDAHMDDAITWNIGTISLVFADDAAPVSTNTAKPELHHTFRQPEKRPLAIVSLVFTAAILASALLLFILLSRLNFRLAFPSGDKFLPVAGFHITLGLIMALYFAYWWCLNMFQCLTYLIPLSIVAILLGSRALA